MERDLVWWTLVNSSANLVETIKEKIAADEDIFLYSDAVLPWKNTFYELIRKTISEVSSQRTFNYLSVANENNPGLFLINKMFPESIRSEYWPDISCAQFLSEQNDNGLNRRIVWIKDISNETQLEMWFNLIADYNKLVNNSGSEKALFIVEYTGMKCSKTPPSEIKSIPFISTSFDRYILCLSLLSEINEPFAVKQYIAELACCLGKENTELCGALAETGIKLAHAPELCVKSISRDITYDEVHSCILMAQIKLIFPMIEQFRMQFVKSNEKIIKSNLPIENTFHEIINEPTELELGDLCAISRKYNSGFDDNDKRILNQYRMYRNMLAHNNIISWQEAVDIINK